MDPRFDLMALLNKLFCTYDEIATRDNLAINDLIAGMKGISPKFKNFANTVDSVKRNIHAQFMISNEFFNSRNWWYLHSIDLELVTKIVRENIEEDEFNEHILE